MTSTEGVHVASPDEALVRDAKAGDTLAFEVLVSRHRRRVLAMVQRFTRNQEDAEDVLQQALQNTFVHLQKFAGNSSFRTWLTRIAINEALMSARRKHRLLDIHSVRPTKGHDEDGSPVFPDFRPNPEEQYLRTEQERMLLLAINRLSPALRRAVKLRELDELSILQTAQVIGVSIAAVKGRVFHARRKLRQILEQRMCKTRAGCEEGIAS
jgi:RNA polymerase sigma factor (sigma-70 family)